jgi:diadenosine tetraphosphate (Ap4A) HIT family hydrolase
VASACPASAKATNGSAEAFGEGGKAEATLTLRGSHKSRGYDRPVAGKSTVSHVDQTDCPLCQWADDPEQRLVLGNDAALFLQNSRHQGVLVGSGVIIPARHAETVFDLTLDEVSASFQLLAEVKRWMDATYRPQGYNVGWNCWPVGGQDIMHAHMHVVPRFAREPYAGRGIRYWMKQEANRWR